MGNGISYRGLKNVYSVHPDVAIHKSEFSLLHLHEHDIGQLYVVFSSIVKTVDGVAESKLKSMGKNKKKNNTNIANASVAIVNVLAVLKIVSSGNNKFALRLFSSLDTAYSGKMTFREFVLVVWGICTADAGSMDRVVFDLYRDSHSGGRMIVGDVKEFIGDLYGEQFSRVAIARRAYYSLDSVAPNSELQEMSSEAFSSFCSTQAGLLRPVSLLKEKLMAGIVGVSFWTAHLKQRNYMSGGRYLPASQLLHKARCTQQELERKQHANYLKLTYGNVNIPYEDTPSSELNDKQAAKIRNKQELFSQFSKLTKLDNFFTHHGKKYISPYTGMKKSPSKHVQKKQYVQAKEKRLGISSDDPDSLASSRLKQRAEKKKSKLNRVQEMVANKARLEESNLEKDMEIEDLESVIESKDEEIERLKSMLRRR